MNWMIIRNCHFGLSFEAEMLCLESEFLFKKLSVWFALMSFRAFLEVVLFTIFDHFDTNEYFLNFCINIVATFLLKHLIRTTFTCEIPSFARIVIQFLYTFDTNEYFLMLSK